MRKQIDKLTAEVARARAEKAGVVKRLRREIERLDAKIERLQAEVEKRKPRP